MFVLAALTVLIKKRIHILDRRFKNLVKLFASGYVCETIKRKLLSRNMLADQENPQTQKLIA